MARLRFLIALLFSKAVAFAIRLVAHGRGTNLPGIIAFRIDPEFLAHFRGLDPARMIFVTGTNGKSTTVNLLYRILTDAGCRVIANLDGANMTPGVAVPLLRSSSLTGKITCDYVVMETDERYVARIRKQLPAKYLCVTNIQKDQVQRNGEPGLILTKLRDAITPEITLFVNQDEPNACSLKRAGAARTVTYGVEPGERSVWKPASFFSVTMPCPVCHSALQFDACNLAKVGPFRCPSCGLGGEGRPDYLAEAVHFSTRQFSVAGQTYAFHYNAPQFLYSYILALAVGRELGISEASIAGTFDRFRSESSRMLERTIGGHSVHYRKMKQENSETIQDIADAIADDPADKLFMLGLDEYVDLEPPYLNTCFLFDCEFDRLRDSGIRKWICMAPYEANSAALCLEYNGFPDDRLLLLPGSSEQQLTEALTGTAGDTHIYLVEELPYWQRLEAQKS